LVAPFRRFRHLALLACFGPMERTYGEKALHSPFSHPKTDLKDARELIAEFVRELARTDARRDRAKVLEGDWRKNPRKRALTPPEDRD
jgi:hypothetical protein